MTDSPEKRPAGNPNLLPIEERDPDLAMKIVEALRAGKSIKRISEELSDLGVGEKMVRGVKRRLVDPAPDEEEEFSTKGLIEGLERFQMRAVRELNSRNLGKEKTKELMLATAIAIDKTQLVKGLPTQIVSTEDRRALPQVARMIAEEMARRGLEAPKVVEGEFVEVKGGEDGAQA